MPGLGQGEDLWHNLIQEIVHMKITNEVWQVGGDRLTAPEDAAIYMIHSGEQAALIDAGTGKGHKRLIKNIQKCGVSTSHIKYLFLTHCHFDHTGGAQKVRDECDCTIVAHESDALYLEGGNSDVTAARWYGEVLEPLKVDYTITSFEESFRVGKRKITSFHTPGHSPGSVVYLVESEGKKILFGQDVHGPLDPSLLSNREYYIQSLQFLLSLKIDILCEGHFGVFEGEKNIQSFIKSFL
jgi:glyoxylase-like metal-dependent hydrolase (beta-lactamase superfamily II)